MISERIKNLNNDLLSLSGTITTHLKYRQQLLLDYEEKSKSIKDLELNINLHQKGMEFLNFLINKTRTDIYNNLANIVNYGAKEMFGPETEFKIEPDIRGNIPTCKFFIKTK